MFSQQLLNEPFRLALMAGSVLALLWLALGHKTEEDHLPPPAEASSRHDTFKESVVGTEHEKPGSCCAELHSGLSSKESPVAL